MFDFFKKRKKKEELENIKKENASKVFNNTFFHKKAIKLTSGDLDSGGVVIEFFNSIKNEPKVVEYILENAPPAYPGVEYDNATMIRCYLERDKDLNEVYSKFRKSLKKKFDRQIKKLDFSGAYKFWSNFDKKYTLGRRSINANIDDIKEDINFSISFVQEPFDEAVFNISDCGAGLLVWFWGFFMSVFGAPIQKFFGKSGFERLIDYWKKIFSKFQVGDGIGEYIDKYFEENKLTLEELIEKINNVLKLIANLKFDDINK